jgi:hypothetical protein
MATPACVATDALSLLNTGTCDIGSLQFTFFGLERDNVGYDDIGNTQIYLGDEEFALTDFTFTPVTDGFTLSYNPGPLSISPPYVPTGIGIAIVDIDLEFDVTDLDGPFAGVNVTGTISENGNTANDTAVIAGQLHSTGPNGGYLSDTLEQIGGGPLVSSTQDLPPAFSSALGDFYAASVDAQSGTAYWGGSSTITFDTATAVTTTPEPGSLVLLGSGLALLAAGLRRRKGRS